MKKLKSALPVFPGFYNTHFDSDVESVIEDGKTYDDYEFNYPDYTIDVGRACCNAIEAKLIELGFDLSISFVNIWSPREYNFSNDAVLALFKLKTGCIGKIKEYVNVNLENFATYLQAHFKSCSGFTSFYSYQVSDWLTYINFKSFQHDQIYLEHLLNFILENESYDTMELYYDTIDRHGISIDGWLKEPETEIEETEPELGKLWSYTSLLDQAYNYVFNPNQLRLNF